MAVFFISTCPRALALYPRHQSICILALSQALCQCGTVDSLSVSAWAHQPFSYHLGGMVQPSGEFPLGNWLWKIPRIFGTKWFLSWVFLPFLIQSPCSSLIIDLVSRRFFSEAGRSSGSGQWYIYHPILKNKD